MTTALMSLDDVRPADLRPAIRALRCVFWGALLCLFDVTFSSTRRINNGPPEGFRFDILNDVVGVALILYGLVVLARYPVDDRYRVTMVWLRVIAVASLVLAVIWHVVFSTLDAWDAIVNLVFLAQLAGCVLFCVATGWLCRQHGLEDSQRSWRLTMLLFLFLLALPLGLMTVAIYGAVLTGSSFHINLGPAGLLALVAFAIPIVHLFISTSRMVREAEARA